MNPKYDPENPKAYDQFWKSNDITDNCSASTMRSKLYGYYRSTWGSDISVTMTMYDDGDVETADSSLAAKYVYSVTVLKRITGTSFSSAAVLQDEAEATITIDMPSQESSAPLSGSFIISCPDEQGSIFSTREFTYTDWTNGLDLYLQLWIPHL